jgi:hypothetical protein
MQIELKATREADGVLLAKTSYDDSDDHARAAAIVKFFEKILASTPRGEDLPAFTLDIESEAPPELRAVA